MTDPIGRSESLPFVSIVMPIRNEASFIARNLEIIRDQDYPSDRYEIVVSDGMSDDGTAQLLTEIESAWNKLLVISNPEKIVPTGLNRAIQRSVGEIIIRVDGHVFVEKDFVSESVRALQEHPEAWAVGGPIAHSARSSFGKAVAVAMSHRLGVGNAGHRSRSFEGYGEGTAFPAMHRWVFDKVGYYDEQLVRNQDDEFYYRIRKKGGRFYLTPRIRYKYFVRETPMQLFRQYSQYSFWRIPVIRKHRQPTTIRQVVPSLFYLMMAGLLLAGLILQNAWVALFFPVVYVSVLLTVGILQIPSKGVGIALRVPIAILVIHAAYAWGMLQGFVLSLFGSNAWNANTAKLSR